MYFIITDKEYFIKYADNEAAEAFGINNSSMVYRFSDIIDRDSYDKFINYIKFGSNNSEFTDNAIFNIGKLKMYLDYVIYPFKVNEHYFFAVSILKTNNKPEPDSITYKPLTDFSGFYPDSKSFHKYGTSSLFDGFMLKCPLSVAVLDADLNIIYSNRMLINASGNDKEDLINKNILELINVHNSSVLKSELMHRLSTGGEWNSEQIIKNRNNDYFWHNIKISPVFDEQQAVKYYLYISEDITEKKVMDERNLFENSLLNLYDRKSDFGLCVISYVSKEVKYINKKFCELIGCDYHYESICNNKFEFEKILGILKSNISYQLKNNFLKDISKESLNTITVEEKIRLKNGSMLRYHSSLLRDAGNNLIGRYYLLEREQEEDFNSLDGKSSDSVVEPAFDIASDPIIIFGIRGNVVFCNDAAADLFGISKQSMLTKYYADLSVNEEKFSDSLDRIKPVHRRVNNIYSKFRKKNGETFMSEVQIKYYQEKYIQLTFTKQDIKEDQGTGLPNTGTVSNIFENLLYKLKAFEHGQSSHNCLNRLSLYVKNYRIFSTESDSTLKDSVSSESYIKLSALINEFRDYVKPQIEYICVLLNSLRLLTPNISVYEMFDKSKENLLFASQSLDDNLRLLNADINDRNKKNIDPKIISSVVMFIKTIKNGIKDTDDIFRSNYLSNINEIVMGLVFKYNRIYPQADVEFEYNIQDTKILFSSYELMEILNILIENSVEAYISKYGNVQALDIKLTAISEEGNLNLRIKDNGPGISDKIISKLLKRSVSTKGKNRGFGLLYADKTARKYGAFIELEESGLNGTVFKITFKLS